jgi:hypothetical protein
MILNRIQTCSGIIPSIVWITVFLCAPIHTCYGKPTITINKETTYVTEPVDSEGRVDYVAALNERMRQGVTPENNANVLIWQALGPKVSSFTPSPKFFEMMGIKQPLEKGEYFTQAKDSLGLQLNQTTRWAWTEKEHPDVAKWLQQNEKQLALIEEASKRTHFYFPIVPESTDLNTPRLMATLFPTIVEFRGFAVAMKSRAMLKLGAKNFEAAWKDLQTLHRLGLLVAQGPYLIDAIVGLSFISMANEGELILLSVALPSAKQARAWLEETSRLGELPKFSDKWEIGERLMNLDLLQSIAHGYQHLSIYTSNNEVKIMEQSSQGNVDWDPAFRKVNQQIDRVYTILQLPSYRERAAATRMRYEKEKELSGKIKATDPKTTLQLDPKSRGDLIGDAFWLINNDPLLNYDYAEFRSRQLRRNSQIALALTVYKAEQGKYPAQLADLAPNYLKQVPDDLFSGKPLIYKPSKKGYLLYSVGKNGNDDGGEGGQGLLQLDEKDDLVVRMPMRKPKKVEEE